MFGGLFDLLIFLLFIGDQAQGKMMNNNDIVWCNKWRLIYEVRTFSSQAGNAYSIYT